MIRSQDRQEHKAQYFWLTTMTASAVLLCQRFKEGNLLWASLSPLSLHFYFCSPTQLKYHQTHHDVKQTPVKSGEFTDTRSDPAPDSPCFSFRSVMMCLPENNWKQLSPSLISLQSFCLQQMSSLAVHFLFSVHARPFHVPFSQYLTQQFNPRVNKSLAKMEARVSGSSGGAFR